MQIPAGLNQQAQQTLPEGFDGRPLEEFGLCMGCGGIGEHKPDCWCVKLADLLRLVHVLTSYRVLTDPNVSFAVLSGPIEPAS